MATARWFVGNKEVNKQPAFAVCVREVSVP